MRGTYSLFIDLTLGSISSLSETETNPNTIQMKFNIDIDALNALLEGTKSKNPETANACSDDINAVIGVFPEIKEVIEILPRLITVVRGYKENGRAILQGDIGEGIFAGHGVELNKDFDYVIRRRDDGSVLLIPLMPEDKPKGENSKAD